MIFSEEMLQSLRDLTASPKLQVSTSAAWGSDRPGHRLLIRQYLQHQLQDSISTHELGELLNLDNVPSYKDVYVSISHTSGMGLIAVAPTAVGVDVESLARVKSKSLARVSSHEEMAQAPSPAHLWAAKEAAFKALYSFAQPSVISLITIGNWQKINSQTETFNLMNLMDFKAPARGLGVTFEFSSIVMSFFVFNA